MIIAIVIFIGGFAVSFGLQLMPSWEELQKQAMAISVKCTIETSDQSAERLPK
jgi:hypothetical protein